MDPLPTITEAVMRQHASADSSQRGREYYEQGAVSHLVRRGTQLQAEVEGSQYEPYSIQITYDAGGIAQALCSCPFDRGGWCKHIVATLLATVRDPAHTEERPVLHTLLAALDGEQLQALIVRLIELRPELANVVEGQVQRLQLQPAGAAAAPRQRRMSVDPSTFHHAERWLEKARAAYRAAGRDTEWQSYLAELMAQHQRKHSLMPRLKALQR